MSSITNKEDINLSKFTGKQQDAIIGYMMQEPNFFLSCVSHIENTYFASPLNGEIFNIAKELYDDLKRIPSIHEVEGKINNRHHDSYNKYLDQMNMCKSAKTDIGLDLLSKEMTGWIQIVKLSRLIQQSGRMYNKREFTQSISTIKKIMSDIENSSFSRDEKLVFLGTEDHTEEKTKEMDDCLTIGHPDFDVLLREEAKLEGKDITKRPPSYWTKGGLVRGDSTMILGPSNSGKTTTLTSIIVPNILNKRHILYFTHEQKPEDIRDKLYMNYCGMTKAELKDPTPDQAKAMNLIAGYFNEYLVYIPWVKVGEMWVENVLNEIRIQQERLISQTGKGFDMLIDDYPDKLRSKEIRRSGSRWEETDYVYDQFVNAAMQYKFHAILPVQTNRDGYKATRGKAGENRVVDQGDAAGSFGVMQKADNVISLNRTPTEIGNNVMRFFIGKSRSAETHTVFATKTDFKRSSNISVKHSTMVFGPNEDTSSETILSVLVNSGNQQQRDIDKFKEANEKGIPFNPNVGGVQAPDIPVNPNKKPDK